MIGQVVLNALIQVVLFSAIPFAYWRWQKPSDKYWAWLGLIKPVFQSKKKVLIFMICIFCLLLFSGGILIYFIKDQTVLANAKFSTFSVGNIFAIIIYSFVQTGLAEELFFRGFLTKQFSRKWGFTIGNTIQALLFGLVHGVLFISALDLPLVIIVFSFTSMAGWLMGDLNERLSHHSIVPSWMIHGLMNVCSSLLLIVVNVL